MSDDSNQRAKQIATIMDLFEGLLGLTGRAVPSMGTDGIVSVFLVVLAAKIRGTGVSKAGWLMAANAAYDSADDLLRACEQKPKREVGQA